MTKLEEAVFNTLGDTSHFQPKDRQTRLDEVTQTVICQLSPQDILDHMKVVYDETVDEYVANPHNQMVVDELIEFMSLLPEGARVLDVGCGPGRDILFMSTRNRSFRLTLMGRPKNGKKTSEKYNVPTTALRATGLDQSNAMIAKSLLEELKLEVRGKETTFSYKPKFLVGDMHHLPKLDDFAGKPFAGIWSCTALFTHTPRELINPAMQSIIRLLDKSGVFFTSYLNRLGGPYDKLLLSSTGKIKYFSHQNPEEIAEVAKACGLTLQSQSFSDFEIQGKVVKKDFFVSQLFRKE